MAARFNVVIPTVDGGVQLFPMKAWLRDHLEHVPAGLDPTASTSHQLRDGLRKKGWSVHATPEEVRLSPPGTESSEEVIAAVLGEDDDATAEQSEAAFQFEEQLRDFIAQNLPAIDVNGKKLRLYCDEDGRSGVEYPTAVGPIDILAVDSNRGFYVFELKRARSPDSAIGQLARYMGFLRKKFGEHTGVHGVIVAREITRNLRYAIAVFPNVSLFEYEVHFHLRQAESLQDAVRDGVAKTPAPGLPVVSLDANIEDADWTKQSWDMPPYKSEEFFALFPREQLGSFRQLPVYQHAVQSGWIRDDEWVGPADGYCSP